MRKTLVMGTTVATMMAAAVAGASAQDRAPAGAAAPVGATAAQAPAAAPGPAAPSAVSAVPAAAPLPAMVATPNAAAPQPDAPAPVARRMVVHGSLFSQPAPVRTVLDPGTPAPTVVASFIAVTPAQPRKYKKHDLITVIVSEDSASSSTGKADSEKKQDYDLALQQMAQLNLSQSGLPTVGVVGNPSKLPQVQFHYDNNRQNDATNQREDTFTARISAEILDIKPNGTLVLEATKSVVIDREEQSFKLSGICRPEDIQADNSVLSTQIAQLKVEKQTEGEVHDGTRSGWLNKFIDKVNPF